MLTYIAIFNNYLKSSLNYRWELLTGCFFGFIPSLGILLIWNYISNNYGIPGYSKEEIITYVIVAKILEQTIIPGFHWKITDEVRTGALVRYIAKPISHLFYWCSVVVAEILMKSLIAMILSIALLIILHKYLALPSFLDLLMFLIAAGLAACMYFLIYYLISLSSFWLVNVSALFFSADIAIEFLAGVLIPLNLFPENLQKVLLILPFHYMVYYPVTILLGKMDYSEVAAGCSVQLLWILGLVILIKYVWRKAITNYDGSGS